MRSNSLLALMLLAVVPACLPAAEVDVALTPPKAPVVPHVDTIHGTILSDDYYWLRDRGDSTVLAYIEAENNYTSTMMQHTEDVQERLFEEMRGRIKETDMSVPVRYQDYYYFGRTEEGRQYEIYCRKAGSLDTPEQVVLDLNTLADGHDFYSVGAFEISPNQQLLAYAFDTTGSESYTLVVKDLQTGQYFTDSIPNVTNAVWAADNRTIFYTVEDETRRPYRLYRHQLGDGLASDTLIYEEPDPAFYLGISETRSREYLFLSLNSQVTSETHYLRSANPMDEFRVIAPREQGVEYRVAHQGDTFYITTNKDAVNFRLMSAPVADPGPANWTEVIPARDSVLLEGIDCFEEFLVIYERDRGLPQIRIRNLADGGEHQITFDQPIYSVYPDKNPSYDSRVLRFSFQSMITPTTIYDYDMATRERTRLKQTEVLGGFDPANYEQERVWAVADDGTRIPISLCYRKGMEKNGSNPLFLYGYGSYGITMEPWFSSNRISLLDRGFVYAVAHIRGGGYLGRTWYEDGKLLTKRNTFTDFIACGDYLVKEGYTAHERMVISGGSAGGLLIGAVVNMRPDLAAVAIADVPFVDVINTMLDETIPLTVIEFEEWGNPNDSTYFEYIRSYSPYDNVADRDYPAMLVLAGLNDPRVQYWEPAKWTARLRAVKTDDSDLLLKTNMGAGHMGASGRYDYLKEVAFEYAFIFDQLGMLMK